ncbi:hypothetical protein [Dactylosporangium sp. NPDC005555]|uniref:hypothetical protein n=1 Tax=Dactylosporangium sp. NPDC005555 TaxID=3154889 RepID=UPI0033AB0665
MSLEDRWRTIDATQFSDGVLYLSAMVEIQPRMPDWGLPNMPDIMGRLDEDRPHGGDEASGKLLCLRCMAIRARRGEAPAPIWMYFQRRGALRLFCHIGSNQVHAEHMPESAEHKALVEREVQTCVRVGASVDTEVRAANGRRRADFVAVGPDVVLAGEIQRSTEPARRIGQRQRDLSRDGKRVLWTTDNVEPGFLKNVPRLVIPNLTGWQQALRDPELAIVAGMTLVEYQRCGWSDQWSGTTRCPHTNSLRPCGKIHAYPTLEANTHTYRPTSGPVMQFGMGNRPHLDVLVAGIVLGDWLPYQRKARTGYQFVWMPTEDYKRFVEDRGGTDTESAERNAGLIRQRTGTAERNCETDRNPPSVVIDLKPAWSDRHKNTLNWTSHQGGDPAPCRHCGRPAIARDEHGLPMHKTCAEKLLAR